MATQAEKAEAFRALHHGPRPLVLPNAWDVPSARIFEDEGFPAVATTSAALMVSLGYRDGEEIPRRDLVAAIGRIAGRLSVPVSADIVAGFGRTPRQVSSLVRAVISAGAVGINLEDHDPAGGGLLPAKGQVRKIRSIRALAKTLEIPIVINGRTDAFRLAPGDAAAKLHEAVTRATAYRDAGADCVYPMGLTDRASIASFVEALQCPVNVMIRAGLPSVAELADLGVKRISFGPAAAYVTLGLLKRVSREVLDHGTFESLLAGAITHDDLNRLAVARSSPPPP